MNELLAKLEEVYGQGVAAYTPLVESLIAEGSRNTHQIEDVLDGLLGFCGYKPALELFRKLCRYYYNISPSDAVSYVQAYREMWGDHNEP